MKNRRKTLSKQDTFITILRLISMNSLRATLIQISRLPFGWKGDGLTNYESASMNDEIITTLTMVNGYNLITFGKYYIT